MLLYIQYITIAGYFILLIIISSVVIKKARITALKKRIGNVNRNRRSGDRCNDDD